MVYSENQMSNKERPPYYFLDRSINVLLVDDDESMLKYLAELIGAFPMYQIECAGSAHKALSVWEPPKRFHACITDLGIDDMKGDEFYLLRHFGRQTAFLVLTGTPSPIKGFTAGKLGARALIEKSCVIDQLALMKALNFHALLNVINPMFLRRDDNTLSLSTDLLFSKSPVQVTEWALELGISDRELRHIWKQHLGANAKIILFIYQVYRRALAYYEGRFMDALSGLHLHSEAAIEDRSDYTRMEEYFFLHRSTISDYIEFGNIVNFAEKIIR